MLNGTELTTDQQWVMFEAACNEVGIHPIRCPDHRGDVTYRLPEDERHHTVTTRKAIALCARAMGIEVMRCWVHAPQWTFPCEVPVADVIRDPWTTCGDA